MSLTIQQLDAGDDWSIDQCPDVLADIYNDDISIAIWQRQLHQGVTSYLSELMSQQKNISLKLSGTPEQLMAEIHRVFPSALIIDDACLSAADFYEDIHQLLEMFACLFDAKALGVRIDILERAMCPRFHVDNINARLITTYHGLATEWLPNQLSDRSALGSSRASAINKPGAIIADEQFIQRMSCGDVALLKGEYWQGNEGRGVIHRSPALTEQQPRRLVVTCDLIA